MVVAVAEVNLGVGTNQRVFCPHQAGHQLPLGPQHSAQHQQLSLEAVNTGQGFLLGVFQQCRFHYLQLVAELLQHREGGIGNQIHQGIQQVIDPPGGKTPIVGHTHPFAYRLERVFVQRAQADQVILPHE